jgi:hypothetical protein
MLNIDSKARGHRATVEELDGDNGVNRVRIWRTRLPSHGGGAATMIEQHTILGPFHAACDWALDRVWEMPDAEPVKADLRGRRPPIL